MAAELFGDMVKGVVDVEREVVALEGELHADLEALLMEQGSNQKNLWGINLYPDLTGDGFLEFDSLINLRPSRETRAAEWMTPACAVGSRRSYKKGFSGECPASRAGRRQMATALLCRTDGEYRQ